MIEYFLLIQPAKVAGTVTFFTFIPSSQSADPTDAFEQGTNYSAGVMSR
jgi:hypothetical protein